MTEPLFPSWLIPALFLTLGFLGGLVTGAYIAAKYEVTRRYRQMSDEWLKKYGTTQPKYGPIYREGDRRGV